MAKRKNEEGVFNRTSSPSKNQETERKAPAKKVSRKQQFEVVGTPGRNFAIGGRYFNTGSEDWYSPGGRKYAGIANNQEFLQWIYDWGPLGATWVKAPEGHEAPWAKFI